MINNSTAMVRKLKEFFDRDIGFYAWDRVRVTHIGKGEEDEYEFVGAEYPNRGRTFSFQVVSPEDAPPLGKLEMRSGTSRIAGPLCAETFARMKCEMIGDSVNG